MAVRDAARRLCFHGALLFLLGLLNGAVVQAFANPRMGLSAHLGAVQSGLALLAFGLVWPRLSLAPAPARVAAAALIASLYAIWIALLLAAVLGTSQATPIAGAGYGAGPVAEWAVLLLLYAGSAGSILGAALVVWGLRGSAAGPAA